MGRHSRAATPSASGQEPDPGRRSAARRRRRTAAPVTMGLLGACAALSLGVVAVNGHLTDRAGGPDGAGDDRVRAQDGAAPAPTETSVTPAERSSAPADDASRRAGKPEESGPRSDKPSRTPSATPTPSRPASSTPTAQGDGARDDTPRGGAGRGDGDGAATNGQETAAEGEVLALVNQERAQAGCRPVKADPELAALAGRFSVDMAERGFFSHTTPDGKSPWDRAEAAGIEDLGGENIARGQANARSVMDAWMKSPGHRANILNCDYRTLGVGAHFAEGGPWWTQDFGF
ncbi:CAP domain-containing protein [Streptomyces albus]|uniref:CAP domain-containing protein n=1 Tax=Streptomyces albus TaxID=1888 RepID=UPI00099E4A97|nr:CAP domain-containing protein [Streptomyces albus]